MGGNPSKEPAQQQGAIDHEEEEKEMKRASSSRASELEEKAWMDMISQQTVQANAYKKKFQKKNQAELLLEDRVIFVVGGPGSGKGTQCTRLATEFDLCHLSVGDLLRSEAGKGSERGMFLDELMKEGKIVPMEITLEVVRAAMEEKKGKAGFLIDGFPRELEQAKEFEEKVAKCTFVLYFECSEEEMVKRLLSRAKTSGRADDNIETIQKRLETFKKISTPVIEHYQKLGKVKTIPSEKDVDEVYEDTRHMFTMGGIPQLDIWEELEQQQLLSQFPSILESRKSQQGALMAGNPSSSLVVPQGSKKALVVGLNYLKSKSKRNLGGCIKDVMIMERLLSSKFGFQVLAMSDERGELAPSAENILYTLSQMVQSAEPGDHIVFYFSGHMGCIKDGDETHDTFFTADGPIFDFEIMNLIQNLNEGIGFTGIFDSCNPFRQETGYQTLFQKSKTGVFLVSSSPTERSKEMPFTSGGAMTNTLCALLREKGHSITIESLWDSLSPPLKTLQLILNTSNPRATSQKYLLDQEKEVMDA